MDALSSLESPRALAPMGAFAGVPGADPLDALTSKLAVAKENEELRAKLATMEKDLIGAQAKIEAKAKRVEELEKGGGLFGGKWKARVSELEAQVESLMETNAKLTAELESLKSENPKGQSYLPAVVEAQHALALVREEVQQARFAVAKFTEENASLKVKVDDLEFQRDERDDMLRQAEARAATAKTQQKRTAQQAAIMRRAHLLANDPTAGAPRSDKELARTRVLAGLGNVEAQVMLGGDFMDNTCAMCRASPACEKERLLNWPHGTLIPREVQNYLQILVDDAQQREADPFEALERWASGSGVEDGSTPAAPAADGPTE